VQSTESIPKRLLSRTFSADKDGRQEASICDRIREIFIDNKESYGSSRISQELSKEYIHCSRRRVCKLMRKIGIAPKHRHHFKSITDSNHRFKVYPNLLMINFTADAADKAWVSDVIYIWTDEGCPYLASVSGACEVKESFTSSVFLVLL
jgi:transposase InsO family protein